MERTPYYFTFNLHGNHNFSAKVTQNVQSLNSYSGILWLVMNAPLFSTTAPWHLTFEHGDFTFAQVIDWISYSWFELCMEACQILAPIDMLWLSSSYKRINEI